MAELVLEVAAITAGSGQFETMIFEAVQVLKLSNDDRSRPELALYSGSWSRKRLFWMKFGPARTLRESSELESFGRTSS